MLLDIVNEHDNDAFDTDKTPELVGVVGCFSSVPATDLSSSVVTPSEKV